MELEVIGASLLDSNKVITYSTHLKHKVGDKIVVHTPDGLAVAVAKKANVKMKAEDLISPVDKVERFLTHHDKQTLQDNSNKEQYFNQETQKMVKKLKLDMKLVKVKLSFDGSKAYFLYVSEDRVDFRELVKLMATTFKVRIELKQIGVRDEAREKGGLGPCGRICCCQQHLPDFENVSIKMAKTQNLSLNPQKISGLCGRLMCCLAYENDQYKELLKDMPKINTKITNENGTGTVSYLDIFKRKVTVKYQQENSTTVKEYTLDEFNKLNGVNKHE